MKCSNMSLDLTHHRLLLITSCIASM